MFYALIILVAVSAISRLTESGDFSPHSICDFGVRQVIAALGQPSNRRKCAILSHIRTFVVCKGSEFHILGAAGTAISRLTESGDFSSHSKLCQNIRVKKSWPHGPFHGRLDRGTVMVTGSTYLKAPIFSRSEHLNILRESTLSTFEEDQWDIHAYVFFPNHYHVLVHRCETAELLSKTIGKVHRRSATGVNRFDAMPGRKVWHQYWESEITFEKSYLARIKYIHENPVKHKVVRASKQYEWTSLNWFEVSAPKSFQDTIESLDISLLRIADDF